MIGPPARPVGHENGAALTLAWRRVILPGFALPRDAGRRPAFQAVRAITPSAIRALRPIRRPVAAAFSRQPAGASNKDGRRRVSAGARGEMKSD